MIDSVASDLLLERRGPALWLKMNRPTAYNALSAGIVSALDAAMDLVLADRSIRALVITGEGRAFCAGADLKGVQSESGTAIGRARSLKEMLESVGRVFDRLERLAIPTIAAVNGVALAGGVELILCCDFAVAVETATFGEGHAKFAQLPGAGGSVRLPKRIGAARAKYMMFTGEILNANKAMQWGLVDIVAPAEDLDSTVDVIVQKMSGNSALVLARMKALVFDGEEQAKEVALSAEIAAGAEHSFSHDRNEGLGAFVEKRKPVYRGN